MPWIAMPASDYFRLKDQHEKGVFDASTQFQSQIFTTKEASDAYCKTVGKGWATCFEVPENMPLRLPSQ